jgi:hypothetical protein
MGFAAFGFGVMSGACFVSATSGLFSSTAAGSGEDGSAIPTTPATPSEPAAPKAPSRPVGTTGSGGSDEVRSLSGSGSRAAGLSHTQPATLATTVNPKHVPTSQVTRPRGAVGLSIESEIETDGAISVGAVLLRMV